MAQCAVALNRRLWTNVFSARYSQLILVALILGISCAPAGASGFAIYYNAAAEIPEDGGWGIWPDNPPQWGSTDAKYGFPYTDRIFWNNIWPNPFMPSNGFTYSIDSSAPTSDINATFFFDAANRFGGITVSSVHPLHEGTAPLFSESSVELRVVASSSFLHQINEVGAGFELAIDATSDLRVTVTHDFIVSGGYPIDGSVRLFSIETAPDFPTQSGSYNLPAGLHFLRFRLPPRTRYGNLGSSPEFANQATTGTATIYFEALSGPLVDSDEDGFVDSAEILAGTDALDRLDYPGAPPLSIKVAAFSRASTSADISWDINRNRRTVRVERTSSLDFETWTPVAILTNGTSFRDLQPPNGRAFYRLVVPPRE